MSRSHKALIKALRSAEREGYPVEIERGEDSWLNWVYGFVAGISDGWIVLQRTVDWVYFDGYDVLRIADINRVEDDREGGYIERAVAGLGGRPAIDFHLPDHVAAKDVLREAADHSDIIGVYLEAKDDAPLLFGHLGRLGVRKFEMHLINPRGVWMPEPTRWWYKDVTSVSVGGRYADALERFGDERKV